MVSDGHRYAAHTPVQSQSALSCAGRAALLIGPHCGTNRKRFNWKPLKGRISHSSSILQSKQTTGDPKRGFTCLYLPKLWKAANRYPGKRSKSISAFPSWLERMGFGEFNSLRRRVFAMLFKRFELASWSEKFKRLDLELAGPSSCLKAIITVTRIRGYPV